MQTGRTISVAMCTYNGEKHIREQLQSLAAQTRLPAELVVCDDRSSDATMDIIREFSATAPFPVRLHLNPVNLGRSSKGITRNFEQASAMCEGDLVAFSDQDDIWLPEKLARMAQTIEERPGLRGVFVDAEMVDEQGTPKGTALSDSTGMNRKQAEQLGQDSALGPILSMRKVYGCTLMADAPLLRKVLPVPEHWWFDAWVAAMAATHGGLVFLPERLIQYRIHSTQSVGAPLPTLSGRMRQWRDSAKEYWEMSEPQLVDIYERLASENDPALQPYLNYLKGRMELLRFRAELPANPITRALKILPRTQSYNRYFNGWKSLVKDLTA